MTASRAPSLIALMGLLTAGLLGGCSTTGAAVAPLAAEQPSQPGTVAEFRAINELTWGANAAALQPLQRSGLERYLSQQLHPAPAQLPPAVQAQIDAMTISQRTMGELASEMAQRWVADGRASERLSHLADAALAEATGLTGPAVTRRLATRFDAANRARDLLRTTVRADLAVLEVEGLGTLEEREKAGDEIDGEERALMQRALDENSVIVAQMTPFFD